MSGTRDVNDPEMYTGENRDLLLKALYSLPNVKVKSRNATGNSLNSAIKTPSMKAMSMPV